MPELPEVETIRRGLARTIVGQPIRALHVRQPRLIRGSVRALQKALIGQTISRLQRRGKLLALALSPSDSYLLLHLKMTGQLIYEYNGVKLVGGHRSAIGVLPNKYSHVIFTFQDGSRLFFNDQRQFGYVQLVSPAQKKKIWDAYGPEPLSPSFTLDVFKRTLRVRKTGIKAALLNQAIVAGLGNIYVDEICWWARVRPDRRLATLTDAELKTIHRQCQRVIRQAVANRGTTFSHYRDVMGQHGGYYRLLKVYDRAGQPCRRCGTAISKSTVAGRGTHFCPLCQQ